MPPARGPDPSLPAAFVAGKGDGLLAGIREGDGLGRACRGSEQVYRHALKSSGDGQTPARQGK
jgi:hypothetical protein